MPAVGGQVPYNGDFQILLSLVTPRPLPFRLSTSCDPSALLQLGKLSGQLRVRKVKDVVYLHLFLPCALPSFMWI